ncbi:hypothetical protein BUALT_Bualt07G0176900 [Buddleja alternifolia]|uniref:Senataxin n=1 Tax=Buddleja alternifolia TaxID=168488 RepID=A0AAV6XMI4_9LAMI|nr:hypothetical protein BUALT_Bualt07G0176900 [Buddleja alternifolia]
MEQQRQEMMQEIRRLMVAQMEKIVKNLNNTKGKEPMHAQSSGLNIPSHSQMNENGHHSPSPVAGGINPNSDMAKKEVTRKELLERWSVIEQEDDDDGGGGGSSIHPIKRRRLRQLKEQWFSDAFNFLIYLPKESHVWCAYWDLMGPLLETFYNYFKEECHDSPLKLLWNRISKEMRSCTLCIHQHHQAQEMYATEYELSCISPLLDVLHTLDEERISQHLKDLNARIVQGEYDATHDYGEVVSVMFEFNMNVSAELISLWKNDDRLKCFRYKVLMFPILLDDHYLATEFQVFIEAIDNSHELTLDGHQQYPGVYALLFLKSRRVRSIGLRLAGHMGKLSNKLFLFKFTRIFSLRQVAYAAVCAYVKDVSIGCLCCSMCLCDFMFLWIVDTLYPIVPDRKKTHAKLVQREWTFTDLDPLQHLLKKSICILETEGSQSAIEASRPRVQLDRVTVWLGMKALLGFLEPPAFEEGILDRYPIFLSIVLNHISDDSLEFSHAVNCLRLLFEKLGCKLWLRATLSPSVMRNTLLGQCFHTRNEKSHKEIFDLFQPFLQAYGPECFISCNEYLSFQSLEALQDGEHEKQRRHFLYFLLHQVPVSSNFSTLMREKACQIALLIILRGYRMDPPCPPFECAHMWGPSLVSSLKNPSLHSSLRKPAIDLIQTIIVSDASALISVILNGQLHPSDKPIRSTNYGDEEDEEEIMSALHIKEKDVSCWKEFSLQHKVISQVDGSWMCVPMLWFDVLVEIDPSVLPLSFSKAVFWALSRFSVIEPENSTEMALSFKNWLVACATEISYLFGWKVPSGSDDGGDGTESRNSIRTSTMCLPLVRTFKRLAVHYAVRMEEKDLRKQWTWEPMMSNSLILLLVDPNDNTRQVGRLILEQVSNMRGLTFGLKFLCSTPSSLLSVLSGLRHALQLVQLDSVLLNFQTLHHLFFVLCKLLKEGNSSIQTIPQNQSDVSEFSKLSLQGGFLKQPVFDSSPVDVDEHSSIVSSTLWKKFGCLLSQLAWPSILKCLDGGKTFTDYTVSQMTCIRLLEVIPVVFERLPGNSRIMVGDFDNIKWLHDLADWGKSSLAVVVRYWKQTLAYLLGQIKATCSNKSALAIDDIEKLISYEKVLMDEVSKQVARLSVSLKGEGSALTKTCIQSKHSPSGESLNKRTCSAEDSEILVVDEAKVNILDPEPLIDGEGGHVIILSDDEKEPEFSDRMKPSNSWSSQITYDDNHAGKSAAGIELKVDLKENDFSTHGGLMVSPESCDHRGSFSTDLVIEKMSCNKGGIQTSHSSVQEEPSNSKGKEIGTKDGLTDCFLSQGDSNLRKISDGTVNLKQFDSFASQRYPSKKAISDISLTSASNAQQSLNKPLKSSDEIIKDVVCDTEDDTWKFSFFKPPRRQQTLITKPNTSGPKRKVIQLTVPMGNRHSSMRLDGGVKRFQPPRLDDWYRPILELDFFVAVGLASGTEKDYQNDGKLKEVPVCFQTPDGYVEIFRPLVLEEFKAQLQSSYQEMSSAEEMCYGSLSVLSVERIDDFHVVRFVHDENESTGSRSLMENDLVLLTRQPLRNSISDVHTVGKVERREKDNKRRLNILAIRLYLQGCSRLNRARKLLNERSKWYVSRVMSITPQLREFQALSSIREIPLLPIILNPVNHPCGQYESRTENLSKLSQPLQQIFKSSYNGSQLQAISLAIGPFDLKKDFDLTLIQGPPGTGKTRTIVAIVSGLLAFSQMKDAKKLTSGGPFCGNSSSTNQRISESAAIARAWQDAALARQLNKDVENSNKNSGCSSRGRILICAQSNAAVDELVARVSSEGLYGCNGKMYKPYLVRVGNAKTVHTNSLPFFIDTLVENRLGEEKRNATDVKKSGTSADSLSIIRSNLEKLVDRIRYYEAKRASLQGGNSDSENVMDGDCGDVKVLSDAELKEKLRQLYEKKKAIYADLASVQAREKKASEEIRALRHKFRTTILKEAEIVVTTLSGCGGDLYGACAESASGHKFINSSESTLFDAVVIDEAAQVLHSFPFLVLSLYSLFVCFSDCHAFSCIFLFVPFETMFLLLLFNKALEPATLIPLQLLKSRGTKCIMVGDPKQLPATVLSNVASKYLFQCSMFERLQRAGHPVIMLTQQYRMHPEICRFPSSHFYEGKLLNGDQMSSKVASFHDTWCLGPYVFFDIVDGQELRGKNAASLSLYNESEADAAVEVLRFFKKRYPSEFYGGRIGIITPYKRQLSLLRSRFSTAFGSTISAEMEFNTVDGFQGREVDILLLSTVRASGSCTETPRVSSSNLGFVADVRRMNVALTRAKFSLWIFGNARTLQTNQSWASLVEDAKRRNLIISGRKPYSSIYKSGLENRPSSGNPSNISTQAEEVERVKAVAKCVNTEKKIVKHTSERKRKGIGTVSESVCTGEDVSSTVKDAAKDDKKRARDGINFPLTKQLASIVSPNSDNKVLKRVKLASEENQEETDKSCAYKANDKQFNMVTGDIEKGRDSDSVRRHSANSGKVKSRSHKHLRPVADEMCSETIKIDKQLEVKGGASSSERRFKEKGKQEASNQVETLKDSIVKRKQQREAVDALLSSALISSKKSESSLKSSVKRTLSATNTGHHSVRPQKRKNG